MVEFDAPWAPNQPVEHQYVQTVDGEDDLDGDDLEGGTQACLYVDGNGDWAVAEGSLVASGCTDSKSLVCEELGYVDGFEQKRQNTANWQDRL